jgi:twitching motility protein PilT
MGLNKSKLAKQRVMLSNRYPSHMSSTQSIIDRLILKASDKDASDLHISGGAESLMRVNGELTEIEKQVISQRQITSWLESILEPESIADLDAHGDIDFAHTIDDRVRVRVSAFSQQGGSSLAIRILKNQIPTPDDLMIPEVMRNWTTKQTGLVIITGPTGSGKTTTLASLVNEINKSHRAHILTIEDPIELIYPAGACIVHQREIGLDAPDFPRAVRAALREDVDVLVLGEMRDSETISAALSVAETGHLVFASLHTPGAPHAIDRIIDAFAPNEQPLIRSRLASTLLGVVYQRLLPTHTGTRMAAFEILVGNNAIRNLIREGKTHQIPSMMTTAMSEGMRTMSHEIKRLVSEGHLSEEQATTFLSSNI